MEVVDQVVDGLSRILLSGVRELGVACGGGGAGVPEQGLNMAQAQPAFKQVRGPGMEK